MDNVQRKMKLMKQLSKIDISRSFMLVSDKSQEWTALRLTELTKEYKDIIYKYGKVEIKEDEENNNASLQFNYDVLVSPTIPKEDLEEDINFKNLMGDILHHLIEDQLQKDSMQYVNTDD